MRLAAVLVALGLCGCTVVAVHAEGPVRIVPVLGSARIEASRGGAIAIDAWAIGLTGQCGAVAIGFAVSHCAVVDPRADCPVAIVKTVGPVDEDFWGRVASETRVECPQKEH